MTATEIQSFIFPIMQFAVALIISSILPPFIISFAKRRRIFDQPDVATDSISRKIHKNPTPRLGGTGMILGFLATAMISINKNPFGIIIAASILIFLLGLYDDLRNTSPISRLVAQVIIALFTVIAGDLVLSRIYWTPSYFWELPYWFGIILSVFVIVGGINAANMIDGLDGLAGGIILITFSLICYILFTEYGNYNILVYIGYPIIGTILGFLKYNTHPATIFMGDGGSNWLGFFSGVLILLTADYVPTSKHIVPLISILLCYAIPILDTLFVIITRMMKGRSPLTPDQLHMHHGLMKLGLTHGQIVTLMYFIAMILGMTGILPLIFPRYVDWKISYIAPVVFLLLLYYILKKEKIAAPRAPLYSLLISKKQEKWRTDLRVLFDVWEKINRFILYIILVITPVITGGINNPVIGFLAGICFIILALLSFSKRHTPGNDFLHSFALSFGALILLISNNLKPITIILMDQKYHIHDIYNVIFIVLLISMLLFILITFQKKYLLVTPTDFLMLTLPLILILMPEQIKSQWNLNVIAVRSIVLFMAIRTMIKKHEEFQKRIRLILMISLAFLFMTGVMGMKIVY